MDANRRASHFKTIRESPTVLAVGFWLLTTSSPPSQRWCCLPRIKRGPRRLFVGFARVFPCPLRQPGKGSGPRAAHLGSLRRLLLLSHTDASRTLAASQFRWQKTAKLWGAARGIVGFKWLCRKTASNWESATLPGLGFGCISVENIKN